MKTAWSRSWKLIVCFVLAIALTGQSVYAKEREVKVYFEGQLLLFEQPPVIRDGTTLVPFRALFETLGFEVSWDESARKATGIKDDLRIELTINSQTAKVNGASVKLLVPAQIIKGRTMIPLRFVSENSGFEVSYEQVNGVAIIGIDRPGTGGGASAGHNVPEPYVLKGRVVNAEGKPIQGALVNADNQLLHNSNAQGVTDANGYYRIPLGMLAATYHATAQYTVELDGTRYTMDLTPDNDNPFAGNTGAIRNFTADQGPTGTVLFYMMDLIHPQNPVLEPPNRDDVIIVMQPVGPQLDGTVDGDPVEYKGDYTREGYGLANVPIGKYKISAIYAPPGAEPMPLLIRKVKTSREDPFTDSVTTGFSTVMSGIYKIELELKLDVSIMPPPPEEDRGNWWEDLEFEW